jgi:subtilase family serine protease
MGAQMIGTFEDRRHHAAVGRRFLGVSRRGWSLGLLGLALTLVPLWLASGLISSSRHVNGLHGDEVRLMLRLRIRDGAASRAVQEIVNPSSAQFRHLLTPRSFGARFGLSRAELSDLRRLVERDGLSIERSDPQATAITLTGTVTAASRLLEISPTRYRAEARRWLADGRVGVPSALAPFVSKITLPGMAPQWHPLDVSGGGLAPAAASTAYDVGPLRREGILGQGETIAIVSFTSFDENDPGVFAQKYGLSGPKPVVIPVAGGTTNSKDSVETNLDIDVIRAIAPAAQILVYEAPNGSSSVSQGTVIHQIVGERKASIVSDSWGECLKKTPPAELEADTTEIKAALAAGVSIFVASGDTGAYTCRREDRSDLDLSVSWPAASAGVVAVGGTRLYLDARNAYIRETGWEGALSASGGGGGEAVGIQRPRWQSAPGLSGGTTRELPDVSADADPATGWIMYDHRFAHDGRSGFTEVGGTSAATPFWAAATALIDQYARKHGIRSVGFANSFLYGIASTPQPYRPFHDITTGANLHYGAGIGWDAATGLGSPDVYNVARDVVRYLRSRHR